MWERLVKILKLFILYFCFTLQMKNTYFVKKIFENVYKLKKTEAHIQVFNDI